jgi:hypothetical protein
MTSSRPTLQLFALVLALAGVSQAQPIDRPLGDTSQTATPSETERVARTFYDAFVVGDVKTLERCYSPTVKFKDEIFTFDDREGTIGMWRVLTDPSGGAKFSYRVVSIEGEVATVNWLADYKLFGRPIHNDITARLVVRGGVIVEHTDSFSWATWSRQAFPLGRLSTWRPIEKTLKFVMRTALGFQAKKAAEKARAAEAAAAPAPSAPAPTRGVAGELTRRTQ